MTIKLVGNPATVHSVYSDDFSCSPEIWQKLFVVETLATVMRIPLLRLDDHLPSDAHRHTSLSAQELLYSTTLMYRLLDDSAILYFAVHLLYVSVPFQVVK